MFAPTCFHPLKAGRRLNLSKVFGEVRGVFPSPQGGSETVVSELNAIVLYGFHPLKAGRRLDERGAIVLLDERFHPLKAGRRRYEEVTALFAEVEFPSPQGGSETTVPSSSPASRFVVSIPSRRVGDDASVEAQGRA